MKQTRQAKQIKIVDVSAYYVYPTRSGGQVRVFSFNKALALSKQASIEHFSFTPVLRRRKTFVHDKNYTEHVHNPLFYTKGVVLLKLLRIKNYDFLTPISFRFIPMPKKLKNALKDCDVVQIEHPWLFNWIARIAKKANKPMIYVAHNVEYDLNKEFFKKAFFRKTIISSLKKTEEKAMSNASLIFAVSEEDKKRLIQLYNISKEKIVVVPNGVDCDCNAGKSKMSREDAKKKLRFKPDQKIVLFTGANHPPNHEAVNFIEKNLAPEMKEIIFIVLGNVQKLGVKNNVICTDFVDDATTYFKAADLAINPVMSGSGSNLKMFGYLAAGIPIISTQKGIRGTGAISGKEVIVSDLKDFSENIVSLINNKQLHHKLSRNGRILAARYDWGIIAREALKHYKSLLLSSNNIERGGYGYRKKPLSHKKSYIN